MGSSPDDFDALRKLLKLKRYEQPPPRYFDDLSHQVLGRLRGPEGWRRESIFKVLGFDFLLKPACFYGLGLASCALALFGVVHLTLHGLPAATDQAQSAAAMLSPTNVLAQPGSVQVLAKDSGDSQAGISTNPILNRAGMTYPLNSSFLKTARYETK